MKASVVRQYVMPPACRNRPRAAIEFRPGRYPRPVREFRDQVFRLQGDRGGLLAEDLSFRGCTFDNCRLSLTGDPALMSRVRRVTLTGCTTLSSRIGPCHLEDVHVDGLLSPGGLAIVWGALFHRVVLRGDLGSLKINTAIQDPHATPERQAEFDRLRERHYAGVDWALDISEARPLTLEIQGIPARCLVLDPSTQIVVTSSRLQDVRQLDALPQLDEVTRFSLQSFVERGDAELVLVAPVRRPARQRRPVLESFAMLREAGLTDPAAGAAPRPTR